MATKYEELLNKWNAHFGANQWTKEDLQENDFVEYIEALADYCENECIKRETYAGIVDDDADCVGKPFEIVRRATWEDEFSDLAMPVWWVRVGDNVFGANYPDIFEDPKNLI